MVLRALVLTIVTGKFILHVVYVPCDRIAGLKWYVTAAFWSDGDVLGVNVVGQHLGEHEHTVFAFPRAV